MHYFTVTLFITGVNFSTSDFGNKQPTKTSLSLQILGRMNFYLEGRSH